MCVIASIHGVQCTFPSSESETDTPSTATFKTSAGHIPIATLLCLWCGCVFAWVDTRKNHSDCYPLADDGVNLHAANLNRELHFPIAPFFDILVSFYGMHGRAGAALGSAVRMLFRIESWYIA